MKNTFKRTFLAWLSVPALQFPSAIGVQSYLEPTAGWFGSWSAAVGFEMVTSGVNLLVITSPALRGHARRVTFFSVLAAVVFNTLAHYQVPTRVPGGMLAGEINWPALILSFIESLPLAGLSCLVSLLLHQISQEQDHEEQPPRPAGKKWRDRLADLRDMLERLYDRLPAQQPQPVPAPALPASPAPAPAPVPAAPAQPAIPTYPCPGCGRALDTGAYGRAKRSGYCPDCKEEPCPSPVLSPDLSV